MKKGFLAVLLLGMTGLCTFAQTMTLDAAITGAAGEIGARLDRGTKIAVLNFSSTSQALSTYVVDELNNALVNDGRLQVQARNQEVMDVARRELQFNDSDEVSDKSAQQIGRMLGAQAFVNGSMERVGNAYRLKIQVLEVETLTMRYSKNIDIQNNQRIRILASGSTLTFVENYTPAERTGAAALNLALGAGSLFIQKDTFGAILTGVIELTGVTAFIAGVGIRALSNNQKSESQKNLASDMATYNPGYKRDEESKIKSAEDGIKAGEGVMVAGGAVYAAGVVVGAIRAFTVHKPGYVAAIDSPFNIALVSDQRGDAALQLSYTLHY